MSFKGRPVKSKEFVVSSLILLIIISVGLYVRVNRLAEQSLSVVEPYHIYAAESILENGEPTLPSGVENSRSLMFTQAVALSFRFLGINEFAARLPSVIFGTLSIILIFFIGREFFGTGVGLVSAFMVALAPFEIVWSRECRMYAMFQFFFLLGLFTFYKGFEDNKPEESELQSVGNHRPSWLNRLLFYWNINLWWLIPSMLLLFISFTLQPTAAAFYVSVFVYVSSMFIINLTNQGLAKSVRSKYFVSLLLLVILGIAGFIMMGELIKDVYEFSPEWAENRELLPEFLSFFTSKLLFLVTAFFILGSVQICTRGDKAGFYTLVTAAAPIVLILPSSVPLPRYIYHVFPLILLISSYFIYNFSKSESKVVYAHLKQIGFVEKFSPKLVSTATVVILLIFCFLPAPAWFIKAYNIASYPTGPGGEHHAQWEDGCSYIKKNYRKGEILIATIPLAALYHCGMVSYSLDSEHIEDNQKLGRTANGLLIDFYAGTEAITNIEEFKKVIFQNAEGWLILDRNRFDNPNHVPENINSFISNNFTHVYTTIDSTILVFKWDKNDFFNENHRFTR